MKKIKIGGAGIAGLTCAINLAKAGFEVLVLEKYEEVGASHHGDFEGIENWTTKEDAISVLKRFNVDLASETPGSSFNFIPWRQVTIFDSNSQKYDFNSKTPLFYLIKRGSSEDCFDQFLKRRAEKSGVKFILNKAVEKEDVDIVAFGRHKKYFGLGVGIIFKTDLKDSVTAVLDDELSPKAYSYLISQKGEATLVTCLTQDWTKAKEYFNKTLKRFQNLFKFKIENPKNFSCAVSAGLLPSQAKIHIGESAGFQDVLWGFGMRYAILSGYLASSAIINNKDYWLQTKENIYPMIKTGIVNRFIWERLRNRGYIKFLNKLNKIEDVREKIREHHQFDIRRKILFPFAKLSLRKKFIFKI